MYPAGVLSRGNLPFRKESGVELGGITYPGRRKGRRAAKKGRERVGSQAWWQEFLMPALQRQRQEDLGEFQAKREEEGGLECR